MKQKALEYLKKGKSIFPVGRDKKPLVAWQKYQNELPTEQEVNDWWTKWPDANIGMATGHLSGVSVVDIDPKNGGVVPAGLPTMTTVVMTGGGGWHYYYRHIDGVTNQESGFQGVDIRGEGGYVVVPPSIHKSGKAYEFVVLEELLPFPVDIFHLSKKKFDTAAVLAGVGKGERNMTAARLAGSMIAKYPEAEWETVVWTLLKTWNVTNQPPTQEEELRATFLSICKKHKNNHVPDDDDKEVIIAHLADIAETQGETKNIPTGLKLLDDAFGGGVAVGSSVVVAALAGDGKTQFLLTLSYHYAKNKVFSLWFSYEETIAAIWGRFQDMGLSREHLLYAPFDLEDNRIDYIEKVIAKQKENTDFFVVFIDQLSHIAPKIDGKMSIEHINSNFSLYLGRMSQQIKDIAMKYGIIIFVAHQLNRSGDLSYSDMVRHAPDKVVYLKREEASAGSTDQFTDKTFVKINKNRPLGTRPVIPMTVQNGRFVQYGISAKVDAIVEQLGGGIVIESPLL